jgi:hypothetical protein
LFKNSFHISFSLVYIYSCCSVFVFGVFILYFLSVCSFSCSWDYLLINFQLLLFIIYTSVFNLYSLLFCSEIVCFILPVKFQLLVYLLFSFHLFLCLFYSVLMCCFSFLLWFLCIVFLFVLFYLFFVYFRYFILLFWCIVLLFLYFSVSIFLYFIIQFNFTLFLYVLFRFKFLFAFSSNSCVVVFLSDF